MIQENETYLGNLGDGDPFAYGGLFVYVDSNGRAQAELVEPCDDFEIADEPDLVEMINEMAHAVAERWVARTNNTQMTNEEFEELKERLGEYFEEKVGKWTIRRFDIDKCTFINGVLSDNKFHSEHPAWWAKPESEKVERPQDSTYLSSIASCVSQTSEELIEAFCSDDPLVRARAYQAVGDFHGFDNLDSYPIQILTKQEMNNRYNEELKIDKERKHG